MVRTDTFTKIKELLRFEIFNYFLALSFLFGEVIKRLLSVVQVCWRLALLHGSSKIITPAVSLCSATMSATIPAVLPPPFKRCFMLAFEKLAVGFDLARLCRSFAR